MFGWIMDNVKWFWGRTWKMMYIDEVPNTPSVLATMFSGVRSSVHGIKWFRRSSEFKVKPFFVWDILRESYNVVVMPLPIFIDSIVVNASLMGHKPWNLTHPTRGKLSKYVSILHRLGKFNSKVKRWNLFIMYYPIPDKASHWYVNFFKDWDGIHRGIQWFDYSFRLAREFIEYASPKKWLLVGDHSIPCPDYIVEDRFKPPEGASAHVPEALAVSNTSWAPTRPRHVFKWILECLGEA